MKTKITAAALAITLTGCAASPASIPPTYTSSEQYSEYTCKTLSELRVEKEAEIADLYRSQKTKRVVDGFSNVLILPGVASIISDSSTALARSKGEKEALIREYDKRCL